MQKFAPSLASVIGAAFLLCPLADAPAQGISSLDSLSDRVAVGDPDVDAVDGQEGPKAIATADFNGDGNADLAVGNLDGSVTVLFGVQGGGFGEPEHLNSGAKELRAVLASDLDGNGTIDLATASPEDARLDLFFNEGDGEFSEAVSLTAWRGVRSLESGDFDGDGITDIAAAGPGVGLRHYRGTGSGAFEIMGDLPRLSPGSYILPRPVYSMKTVRSLDGTRDDLLLTHADSSALYILSTVPADRSNEPDVTNIPSPWQTLPSPVIITEAQLRNATSILDEDGHPQPWIELFNKSSVTQSLGLFEIELDFETFQLPNIQLEPGEFQLVFLSGKDRAEAEIHSPLLLNDDVTSIRIQSPTDGAHTLIVNAHDHADISFGLPTDSAVQEWFAIPSPGAMNNVGEFKLASLRIADTRTTITVSPENPTPDQKVTITLRTPEAGVNNSYLRTAWFTTVDGIAEKYHPLRRTAAGEYGIVLEPGTYQKGIENRFLARYEQRNGDTFTTEIHPGTEVEEEAVEIIPQEGRLLPVASIPSPKVKAFTAGVVTAENLPGTLPDLVFADHDCGLLRVHKGIATAQRFEVLPTQDMQVRGAPRDIQLADYDGDGWLDASVVLRELDLLLTCINESGTLTAVGELPTGRSPRAAVTADFSGDGKPDAAVINRYSADVSILTTSTGLNGLVSSDQIYPVDGEVSGMEVGDYDGDGLDDVIQLHRGSGELSVRYANPDGSLREPEFTQVNGALPSGFASVDINGDGVVDTITANLGSSGGSISVIVSQPDGSRIAAPDIQSGGALFAIDVADFDSDGNYDIIAGLFDCRVEFYRGDGTGGFTMTRVEPFAYESRVMVTGDFDQDGDIDVAGAGLTGVLVVLENTGTLLDSPGPKFTYEPQAGKYFGANRIAIFDADGDSDPDLLMGTGNGVVIYKGAQGVEFDIDLSLSNSTPSLPVNDVALLDLNGDGIDEMVTLCRAAACINISTRANQSDAYTLLSQASVPAGRFLATGDLDGDDKPDLVCSGDVLWTLLSSREAEVVEPRDSSLERGKQAGVLINEVLSRNTGTPVAIDSGRKTDFIEIYNSTESTVTLAGWKLRVEATQDGQPFDHTFALPDTTISSRRHAVILFSDELEKNPAYTGFNLPAEEGTITLLKADDSVADSTQTRRALDNVSWSRFRDGHPTFHANPIPSPGMSNLDNGTPPPDVKLTTPLASDLVPGQPIRFTARGNDDVGIISMSLIWKHLDRPGAPQRVILYDDGMHDDGDITDGYFAGEIAPGLEADSEIQFYLEATDLSGNTLILPEDAQLVELGDRPESWTISMEEPPTLEIVELSLYGSGAHRDESGKKADFIIVRNVGTQDVNMDGVLLAYTPLSSELSTYRFPPVLTLSPGAEAIVFADNDIEDGPMHAPFTIDGGGSDISLLAESESGARRWIDSLTIPPSSNNSRYLKLPDTDRWIFTSTSDPFGPVGFGNPILSYDRLGNALQSTTSPTIAGDSYALEGFVGANWLNIQNFVGDGTEMSFVDETESFDLLRITHQPPAPTFASIRVINGPSTTWLYIDAPDAAEVKILTSGTVPLTGDPENLQGWWYFVSKIGDTYVAEIPRVYGRPKIYYRLRASNVTGEVVSEPGEADVIEGLSRFNTLHLESLGLTTATVAGYINNSELENIRAYYGTVDGFDDPAAWGSPIPCTTELGHESWRVNFQALSPGQQYFVRFAGDLPEGGIQFSGERIVFTTSDEPDQLAQSLRFSEIMYHPPGTSAAEEEAGFKKSDFDFIELHNPTDTPIDLTGWSFTEGLEMNFPDYAGPVIQPGEYGVIASNPLAFHMRYGEGIPLLGWFLHPFLESKLSNGGERIVLSSPDESINVDGSYNDTKFGDDGGGKSLEFHSDGNWRTSPYRDGSPGFATPDANLSFEEWQSLYFTEAEIADPSISGPDVDPDNDGLSNSDERLFGSAPGTPSGRGQLRLVGETDWYGQRYEVLELTHSARMPYMEVLIMERVVGGSYQLTPRWSAFPVSARLTEDGNQMIQTIHVRSNNLATRRYFRAEIREF